MNTLQFIEETANNELSNIHLSVGDRIEVIAEPGESYNLIDSETGRTVDDIGTERFGDDLLLFSEENDIQVWIRDFWNGQCIPGEDQCFAVLDVPGVDGKLGQVTITQQGQILEHLLAGEMGTLGDGEALCAYITASPVGLFAGIHPGAWMAGFAAVVTGIAIASSDNDDNDSAAPDSPKVSSAKSEIARLDHDAVGAVHAKGSTTIIGKALPGSTVGLDRDGDGKVDYFAKVDAKGDFNLVIKGEPLSDHVTYKMVTIADDGQVSKPADVNVVIDAPDAPMGIEVGDDGDKFITASELDDAGKVKVKVALPDNAKPGYTLHVNETNTTLTEADIANKQVFVAIDEPENGQFLDVNAKITGAYNKESVDTNLDGIKAKVDEPQIERVDVVAADSNGQSSGSTTITGTAIANGTVGIDLDDDGTNDVTATVDPDGNFTLVVDKALEEGKEYPVIAIDKKGNSSEPETVSNNNDTVKPTAPVIDAVVTNDHDQDGQADNTTITGKAESGSTVVIDTDGDSRSDVTTVADGNDQFVFADGSLDSGTVTSIIDFARGDKIVLEDALFSGLSGTGGSDNPLDSSQFYVTDGDHQAQGNTAQIIYDRSSGELFYDADGAGGSDTQHFATLANLYDLDANSFTII